jgi:putative two-component system response regulator
MDTPALQQSQIVIAGEDANAAGLLARLLADDGFAGVRVITDPHEIVPTCTALDPDLLLLELAMPSLSGLDVLGRLAAMVQDGGSLAVIAIAAAGDTERWPRALALGAGEVLRRPLDPCEVLVRVRNTLAARSLHRRLNAADERLTTVAAGRSQELARARVEVLDQLAVVAEYRDDATNEHARRVGISAAAIGAAIGEGTEMVRQLRAAAPWHDIGKIAVPDSVLLKPGRLTPVEFELMKAHTTIGASLLAGSESPELRLAEMIALTHHERWDGTGYPAGAHATDVHLSGRIVAVADVFDALVHPRPYKQAWPIDRALREIAAQRGHQFDPDVVDAFMTLDHRGLARVGGEPAAV